MRNILTFDIEDWSETMLELLEIPVRRPAYPTELVVHQTLDVLEMLKGRGIKATFFVLGTVAEKYPELVSKISAEGHEIGSHGYRHRLISRQTPEGFGRDIALARSTLRSITQQEIVSYRAPCFSITTKTRWALDVLADHGFQYDSSIFPIRRPLYGIPGAARFIHQVRTHNGASIVELPLSTLRYFNINFPVAGGGYFRLTPYWFTRWAIRRINNGGHPAIVYIHPHDLYERPPLPEEIRRRRGRRSGAVSEVILKLQALGRRGPRKKFVRLLDEFEFTSIRGALGAQQA
ncbi:MAG: DUF3473 domain-containing protein [Chloroflexi bacterium]|nr:DUF3473 domain-containing protein [Chloroflexota bacterium]